jgi:hypothetical protein
MTQPSPYSNPMAWDILLLNGMPWGGPNGFGCGIEIEGATRFFKVQQNDGQGLDGATQIYRGTKPKPFKLIFTWGFTTPGGVLPDDQDAYWVLFTLLIVSYRASKPGLPPPVYDIYHPSLATLGIGAVLIEEVGAQKVNPDTKLSKAVMVVREFCPPPPVPATVTPIGAPPIPPPPNTGVDPLAAENAALQARIGAVQAQIAAGALPGALP